MESLKIKLKANYAIIEIDNGKVNAINTALVKELFTVFSNFEEDENIKGVILSGRPHCFSAGLDVVALANCNKEELKQFWSYYLLSVQKMVRFSKPFVCAITGFAPAGATILALTADYRIMGKGSKHVIGMHEFKLSMQIPELLCDVYAYYRGEKEAWKAIQNSELYNSDQALNLGLVDESVDVEDVLSQAERHLIKLINVHSPVFSLSKNYFKKGLLKLVDREIEPMIQVIIRDFDDPFYKQTLLSFLQNLKK